MNSAVKSQEMFLSHLLDFSNLPSKRNTEYPNHHGLYLNTHQISMNNHHATSLNQHINKSLTHQNKKNPSEFIQSQSLKQSEAELLAPNNQKLLKSFNSLRDKLSLLNKENSLLKQSLTTSQEHLQQQRQREAYHLQQIAQLNKKLSHSDQELTQYKMRLNGIKHSMQETQARAQELERNRMSIQHLVEENKRLKEEIQVNMQMSIQQKLQLEQQIQELKLKDIQESKSSEQALNELSKKNSEFIRLETEFKKLKLLYDEQNFMKNINSESIMLQKQNQSLKLVVDELESKLKKQKNKKYQLQTKLLELQEKVRLYGTKTDIYQGELSTIVKKINQVQKQNVKAQNQANSALNQKLSWEEKFYHSTIILQELINRVKRQLLGDAVELAKTCQFRLNKLKNGETLDLHKKPQQTDQKKRTKSSSKKIRAQSSNKKPEPQLQLEPIEKLSTELNKLVSFSNSHSNDFKVPSQQLDAQRTVLKEKGLQNGTVKEDSNLSDVKRKLFNEQTTATKFGMSDPFSTEKGRFLFPQSESKGTSHQPIKELNLEAKIRKQRELMQKKLREKILYHKIEDATSSPVKNKLREQYFNMNGLDAN